VPRTALPVVEHHCGYAGDRAILLTPATYIPAMPSIAAAHCAAHRRAAAWAYAVTDMRLAGAAHAADAPSFLRWTGERAGGTSGTALRRRRRGARCAGLAPAARHWWRWRARWHAAYVRYRLCCVARRRAPHPLHRNYCTCLAGAVTGRPRRAAAAPLPLPLPHTTTHSSTLQGYCHAAACSCATVPHVCVCFHHHHKQRRGSQRVAARYHLRERRGTDAFRAASTTYYAAGCAYAALALARHALRSLRAAKPAINAASYTPRFHRPHSMT